MNPPPASRNSQLTPAEETLRLLATLPAPEGLVNRVQAGLHSSVAPHTATVLAWRTPLPPATGWMHGALARSAAAAAIVCVVAGGGWRVYSRVQLAPSAKVLVMPTQVRPSAGFSTGNAMRVPQTLERPVIAHPLPPQSEPVAPRQPAVRTRAIPAHPGTSRKKRTAASTTLQPK